eukprot:CAMPEP_0197692316 /NCGR_PEP_ID=MMETSP1338-20131121/110908_1 /TAXON_ID=43686 ORGANISM="Pelagodinium beii, Strain RCC1491" /NCGR_SAMPLE_ID=MMETSP1338 /ASSEMBLY_ACC=CAM_ASM_000754 /LENGTH=34 /DNA_ID= /DNA_START= /DNA_END= /DNA_ORIENTATION=
MVSFAATNLTHRAVLAHCSIKQLVVSFSAGNLGH